MYLISQSEEFNCRPWRSQFLTMKEWDCAKSVPFYHLGHDGMFSRSSELPVKILTSVRSLMVSIFKWNGHWHWQFSPAVMKTYPTATPTLWCVLKCSSSTGHILCIFCLSLSFLRTMFHFYLKWFNIEEWHGVRIQCISSGGYFKKNSSRGGRVIEGIFIVSTHYFGNKLPTCLAKGCQSKCHTSVCRLAM